VKFAHLADCHIGAWRDLRLRELNIRSFESAIDRIIEEAVDFMLISGDLFHVNLPELESVRRVVAKLREAREAGIGIYVVYGSHDYSPNATAMIDVLVSGGLLTKVMDAEADEEKVTLKYVVDAGTGVKMCGLSGRSYSMEKSYFEALNREPLEREPGFKVFVMHSAVNEVKPVAAAYATGIPLSFLPRNHQYYAGGHIHQTVIEKIPDYGYVAYPGALFGSTFSDLEQTALGERRGFIVVEFEEEIGEVRFIDNQIREVEFREIDGENRTYKEVETDLISACESMEPSGKIVLIRVKGTLSAGRATDIDFAKARQILTERGAEYYFINRKGLTARETPRILTDAEDPHVLEEKILKEALSEFKVPRTLSQNTLKWANEQLKGEAGLELAKKLLVVFKSEKPEGETRYDFEERLKTEALPILTRSVGK
jgi:exonuclease SbcD